MSDCAWYRIRVRGRVRPELSARLENMRVSNWCRDDGVEESTLEGLLADQAALSGVLNSLYALHLPLVVVECVGTDAEIASTR